MREHHLKTWPTAFVFLLDGTKTHEVRKNDRDFSRGDILVLREWSEQTGYTGRQIFCDVTYITYGGTFGLPPEICVMSIRRLP